MRGARRRRRRRRAARNLKRDGRGLWWAVFIVASHRRGERCWHARRVVRRRWGGFGHMACGAGLGAWRCDREVAGAAPASTVGVAACTAVKQPCTVGDMVHGWCHAASWHAVVRRLGHDAEGAYPAANDHVVEDAGRPVTP